MPEHAETPPKTLEVSGDQAACDGGAGDGAGALGHPAVYLKLGAEGRVRCPYCDREFVRARGAG